MYVVPDLYNCILDLYNGVPDLKNCVVDLYNGVINGVYGICICIVISKLNKLNHLVLNHTMLHKRSTALRSNIICVVHTFSTVLYIPCTVLCRTCIYLVQCCV